MYQFCKIEEICNKLLKVLGRLNKTPYYIFFPQVNKIASNIYFAAHTTHTKVKFPQIMKKIA